MLRRSRFDADDAENRTGSKISLGARGREGVVSVSD